MFFPVSRLIPVQHRMFLFLIFDGRLSSNSQTRAKSKCIIIIFVFLGECFCTSLCCILVRMRDGNSGDGRGLATFFFLDILFIVYTLEMLSRVSS